MLDEVFESFRKTSEASLHMQQEMFKQSVQQWPSFQMFEVVRSQSEAQLRDFRKGLEKWFELVPKAKS
jgi:hypothetical protein